jgi:hypothetical protein
MFFKSNSHCFIPGHLTPLDGAAPRPVLYAFCVAFPRLDQNRSLSDFQNNRFTYYHCRRSTRGAATALRPRIACALKEPNPAPVGCGGISTVAVDQQGKGLIAMGVISFPLPWDAGRGWDVIEEIPIEHVQHFVDDCPSAEVFRGKSPQSRGRIPERWAEMHHIGHEGLKGPCPSFWETTCQIVISAVIARVQDAAKDNSSSPS